MRDRKTNEFVNTTAALFCRRLAASTHEIAEPRALGTKYQNDRYRDNHRRNGEQTRYLVRFAKFWMTFAIRVSARDVFGSGTSLASPKRLGLRMDGQSRRRNNEAVTRRLAIRGRPAFSQCTRQADRTSRSSPGNVLKKCVV